jgi:two-component system response regulator PilR (NtrC family)
VIDIHIPPLRERLDDLPALCESLLARIAEESGIEVPTLSPSMIEQICLAPLKGNVRELENLLHRAVALSEGNDLQVDILNEHAIPAPLSMAAEVARSADAAQPAPVGIPSDLQSHMDRQEREILVQTLRETGFNRTAAAARLGLSLRQIRYRIARLHIDVPASPETQDEPD